MILVTGGAGYIGAHACLELISSGYEILVLDNLSNSKIAALRRVEKIAGKPINFVVGDVRQDKVLERIFRTYDIESVMHFAGLKAVGESVLDPLAYYDNNVVGTLRLVAAMEKCEVRRIVFSSSATVYGVPKALPIEEEHPLSVVNPYGRTKLIIEDILRDLYSARQGWGIVMLRYFNPVGAHPSGLLGEDPRGTPNNLVPFIAQVAAGIRPHLLVWGSDYPTPDGTGIRDYLHVVDLARAHVFALRALASSAILPINLGTGRGYSVLEVIRTFEQMSGKKIPFKFGPRRSGDVAICYANPDKARTILGWEAERSLEEMCQDHWRWQRLNPNGYTEDARNS